MIVWQYLKNGFIFYLKKILDNKKSVTFKLHFFYKSEKSSQIFGESDFKSKSTEDPPEDLKILSHNVFIWEKILSGSEYFVTSNHKRPAIFGNTNIDNTITHNQINAYLIEFIAGLILSSFQPDKINKTPHHKIYIIEKTQANNTIADIANNTKSQKSIWDVNKALFEVFVDVVVRA